MYKRQKVLFLDEPTTYLDVRYQLQILKLIQKLNREYGIAAPTPFKIFFNVPHSLRKKQKKEKHEVLPSLLYLNDYLI